MKKIDNSQFVNTYLNCWANAVISNEDLANSWHSAHNWTVGHMNKILYPLAKALGYCNKDCENCGMPAEGIDLGCKPQCGIYGTNLQQEYYKVDFSLYDYQGDAGWTLDYVIEHENAAFELKEDGAVKYSGWFNEFMKLLPLHCANARVIIGFDEFKNEDGKCEFDKKIKKCEERLASPAVIPSLAQSPIILIIFPYAKKMAGLVKNYPQTKLDLLRIVEFVWADGKWSKNDIVAIDMQKIYNAYNAILKWRK